MLIYLFVRLMLTLPRQHHSFSTHDTLFAFCETENVSTLGGLETPSLTLMPNVLTPWATGGRHFAPHVLKQWLWFYRYYATLLECVPTGHVHLQRTDKKTTKEKIYLKMHSMFSVRADPEPIAIVATTAVSAFLRQRNIALDNNNYMAG